METSVGMHKREAWGKRLLALPLHRLPHHPGLQPPRSGTWQGRVEQHQPSADTFYCDRRFTPSRCTATPIDKPAFKQRSPLGCLAWPPSSRAARGSVVGLASGQPSGQGGLRAHWPLFLPLAWHRSLLASVKFLCRRRKSLRARDPPGDLAGAGASPVFSKGGCKCQGEPRLLTVGNSRGQAPFPGRSTPP